MRRTGLSAWRYLWFPDFSLLCGGGDGGSETLHIPGGHLGLVPALGAVHRIVPGVRLLDFLECGCHRLTTQRERVAAVLASNLHLFPPYPFNLAKVWRKLDSHTGLCLVEGAATTSLCVTFARFV